MKRYFRPGWMNIVKNLANLITLYKNLMIY